MSPNSLNLIASGYMRWGGDLSFQNRLIRITLNLQEDVITLGLYCLW